jgi:hypothetical protein
MKSYKNVVLIQFSNFAQMDRAAGIAPYKTICMPGENQEESIRFWIRIPFHYILE